MSKFVPWLILVLVVVGLVFLFFYSPGSAKGEFDSFAQCLASKNVAMYGAYWCPHCQNQKADFGNSFRYVPYVECTRETEKCLAQKINGYPTWIFPDGGRVEGEMSLNDLAARSGCELKNNQ